MIFSLFQNSFFGGPVIVQPVITDEHDIDLVGQEAANYSADLVPGTEISAEIVGQSPKTFSADVVGTASFSIEVK